MKKDLRSLLDDWPFKPDQVNARWIEGSDGKPKIQLRLDLGVLQMEITGRPDGQNPHGFPSLVDYYHSLEQEVLYDIPNLHFGPAECAALQQEAVQYYYRYLAFAALNFHEGVARDTEHNLELFDLVDQYADDDHIAWQFLQFFPYVAMMNARARAELCMGEGRYDEAMELVKETLEDIRHFAAVQEFDDEDSDDLYEIEVLLDLMARIEERRPKNKEELLRERMKKAILKENYEEAAKLRDQLKAMNAPSVI